MQMSWDRSELTCCVWLEPSEWRVSGKRRGWRVWRGPDTWSFMGHSTDFKLEAFAGFWAGKLCILNWFMLLKNHSGCSVQAGLWGRAWRKRNWLGDSCTKQIKGIAHLTGVVATEKWFLLAVLKHRWSSIRGRTGMQATWACALQCTVAGRDLESVIGYWSMLCSWYSLLTVKESLKYQKAFSCV